MNASVKIDLPPDDAWRQAISAINQWRGACLHHFAQGEQAVTETLVALSGIAGCGQAVRLRHLVGQRLDDLAQAVGEQGPFASEGATAAKALAEFCQHEPLRARLAHGTSRIALERNGDWIAIFRLVAIRAKAKEVTVFVVDKAEAETLRKDLQRQSQSLCSHLQNLRNQLSA